MPAPSDIRLELAEGAGDLGHVRDIFLEYGASLDFDLRFQGSDAEIAAQGAFVPGEGRWQTRRGGRLAAAAGGHLGDEAPLCPPRIPGPRRLAEATIETAREIGYRRMRLDTIANMNAAQALCRSMGFTEIPPYYDSPLEGVVYFELML